MGHLINSEVIYLCRSCKSLCHQWNAITTVTYRTPQICGNGKPVGEVLQQDCVTWATEWWVQRELGFGDQHKSNHSLGLKRSLSSQEFRPQGRKQDFSSFGLGAVLMQKKDGSWKLVAYASRAMSDTERCYTQNREGSIGCHVVLQEILWLFYLMFLFYSDRPQATNPICWIPSASTLPSSSALPSSQTLPLYVVSHVPGKELYTLPICFQEQSQEKHQTTHSYRRSLKLTWGKLTFHHFQSVQKH